MWERVCISLQAGQINGLVIGREWLGLNTESRCVHKFMHSHMHEDIDFLVKAGN